MSNNYLSLFEYLGQPAGPNLGKEVFEVAKRNKIPIRNKTVSNKKYSGLIMTYPKDFLDLYFTLKSSLLFLKK